MVRLSAAYCGTARHREPDFEPATTVRRDDGPSRYSIANPAPEANQERLRKSSVRSAFSSRLRSSEGVEDPLGRQGELIDPNTGRSVEGGDQGRSER